MRQAWHYNALVQHLAIGDPQVAQRIAQLGGSVARAVGDPLARAHEGLALLQQQVLRESFVLAYNDLFMRMAALAVATMLWMALLAWRSQRRRAAAASAPPAAAPA